MLSAQPMSTAKFKFLTWTVSGMLGIGMSLYVGSFLARKADIEKPVDTDRMKQILDNVPEPEAKIDDMISTTGRDDPSPRRRSRPRRCRRGRPSRYRSRPWSRSSW